MASKKNNNTTDFFAQYKDPRWQKKRLKIMERDEYSCTSCGDNESTLNVHHRFYRKDVKPWDQEDDELTTLCWNCHEQITELIHDCKILITGRCWGVDSAIETKRILESLDGLNPYQLSQVWKMIDSLLNK